MKRSVLFAFALLNCLAVVADLVPSNMSLAMFRSGRVKEPTVFKLNAAIADWDHWRDSSPIYEERDQYWALRARPFSRRTDAGDSWIVCYAKKTSSVGQVIAEKFKDGGLHAALLSLRYSREGAYGDCCMVEDIQMVADDVPSDLTVKFSASRLGIVKSPDYDYVKGTIGVTIRTKLKYFKKPVLRVVILSDENGARVIRDSILDEPNMKVVSESDTLERNTTTAGNSNNESPFWQRYIEEISASESEVAGDKYKSVTYEGLPIGDEWRKGIKGTYKAYVFGFAKFNKDERASMIGYRLEMWYNGVCMKSFDSIKPSKIKSLALPTDWHVAFKYPEKFKYRSPFAAKDVVLQ